MKCNICGNENDELFVCLNDKQMCLQCYKYMKNSNITENNYIPSKIKGEYSLTLRQKEISDKLLKFISSNDVLINAVTGAGKTEMIYPLIERMVNDNKIIGFCAPRKDLIIELSARINKTFPKCHILTLYGGSTKIEDASLYVFTTHQVSRFNKFFDCLIIDEVDAFPYYGNRVLESLVRRSVKGHIVYMSATISYIEGTKVLSLNRRFHGKDIPVPKVVKCISKYLKILYLLSRLLKKRKIVIIYVSSRKVGYKLYRSLIWYGSIVFVHSTIQNRDKEFEKIRNYEYRIVIATTIMERGVTLENVSVIVYDSESSIFDVSTLLQIVGRVGRKIGYEDGEIYFLTYTRCKKFKEVIRRVKWLNEQV